MLYRSRPRADDDWQAESRDPRVHRGLEVSVAGPTWHDTGLLGADGNPIMRLEPGAERPGFVWTQDDEE